MFEEWTKEKERIESIMPGAESYSLVNNYGWIVKSDTGEVKYGIRHWLNCYGCAVDYWTFSDYSKKGTIHCSKEFDTFDDMIEYLKEGNWK